MRGTRFLLAALVAFAASGCMRQEPDGDGRGLFTAQPSASKAFAQAALLPPSVLQYRLAKAAPPSPAPPPKYVVAPRPSRPHYVAAAPSQHAEAAYAAAPVSYTSATPYQPPYTLDAGDKLRIVVFGQDGISNAYIVDAGGNVSMPLIGPVPARGITTQQLSQRIAVRLKQGYVRDPHVSVEVETYRPFFILGEVTTPGQYPYVADMTVEKAVAIAGGFAPRAFKQTVEVTHTSHGETTKTDAPLSYPLRPGDTVMVKERWF